MSDTAIAPPAAPAAAPSAAESTPIVDTRSDPTTETTDTSAAQAEPTLEDNIAEALRSLEKEDQPEPENIDASQGPSSLKSCAGGDSCAV